MMILLFVAAFTLLIANGFRFEAWIASVLLTLTFGGRAVWIYVKRKDQIREPLTLLVAAAFPWLTPAAWIVGNYLNNGDPFFFAKAVHNYNLHWYGSDASYDKYVGVFAKIDPYLTTLGLLAILVCLFLHKRSRSIQWYAAAILIPFAIYLLMQGGQPEPPANDMRYFAMYLFLFYPALGFMLVTSVNVIPRETLKWGILVLLLAIVATTQIRAAFRFTNDPAADGLTVGLEIRELRAQNPDIAARPIMIEVSYWQYLAIHVGANDMNTLVYDRELDVITRKPQSLLLTDPARFQTCLKFYNISYVIVQDAQLRAIVEEQLHLRPTKEINRYAFYPVSADLLRAAPTDPAPACPLPFGSGY